MARLEMALQHGQHDAVKDIAGAGSVDTRRLQQLIGDGGTALAHQKMPNGVNGLGRRLSRYPATPTASWYSAG